jgi:hypothetical protein
MNVDIEGDGEDNCWNYIICLYDSSSFYSDFSRVRKTTCIKLYLVSQLPLSFWPLHPAAKPSQEPHNAWPQASILYAKTSGALVSYSWQSMLHVLMYFKF